MAVTVTMIVTIEMPFGANAEETRVYDITRVLVSKRLLLKYSEGQDGGGKVVHGVSSSAIVLVETTTGKWFGVLMSKRCSSRLQYMRE